LQAYTQIPEFPSEADTHEALILCNQVLQALHEAGHLAAYHLFSQAWQVKLNEIRMPGDVTRYPQFPKMSSRISYGAAVNATHFPSMPVRTGLVVLMAPNLTQPAAMVCRNDQESPVLHHSLSTRDENHIRDALNLERRLLHKQGYAWDDSTWEQVIVPDWRQAAETLLHRNSQTLQDVALDVALPILESMWDGLNVLPAEPLQDRMDRRAWRGSGLET